RVARKLRVSAGSRVVDFVSELNDAIESSFWRIRKLAVGRQDDSSMRGTLIQRGCDASCECPAKWHDPRRSWLQHLILLDGIVFVERSPNISRSNANRDC